MANIYDVNAAIDKPNFVGNFLQGRELGMRHRAMQQQQQDNAALRGLAPQVIAGDPGAFDQAAAINPEAAQNYQGAGDSQFRRLKGAIDLMDQAEKSGKPELVESYYQQIRPFLNRMSPDGIEPPATFAEAKPKMEEARARIAMAMQGGTVNSVQSTRIGEDGYYYTVDRQGRWTNSGVKADPRTVLRDQPGIDPSIVDLRSGKLSPLGGAYPQEPPANPAPPEVPAGTRAYSDFTAADENGQPITDPAELASIQASIPEYAGSGRSPSPLAAARPAIAPAEQERLRLAQEANDRAAEAAELSRRGNAPTGFRFKPDGSLEAIPGGPKPPGAAASEDERKAAAWLAQANNAYTNMVQAITTDPGADEPGLIETYLPIDEVANRSRSDTRQQYVQASESLSEALLRAATGAGVNRDEAIQKVRELTPRRGDSDAVKKQKMDAIPVYLSALKARSGRASPAGQLAQPGASTASQGASAPRARNPQTGEVLELRNGQWVPVQ